jgi:curved DNA-binding protein CbpA
MHSSAGGGGEDDRIPRIAPGWDPTSCSLTPAEGFLLSRIDGHTSWRELRNIGGIGPEEVDRYLERWAKEGYLVIEAGELAQTQASGSASAPPERSPVDEGLDLPVDLQRRILDFEASLERPYHQLLGVDRGADTREIKLAYFRLSKEFHPDRYFRRSIGDFGPRLDRIFKKVCEAYELLSDPATRAEIERSLGPEPPAEGAYAGGGGEAERIGPESQPKRPQGPPVPMRVQNLMRLRSRFRVPQKLVLERKFKAKQFYRSAQAAAHQKRWLEAAASMRLAIAFDPVEPEYKVAFAEIQADVHRVRADALIEQADGSSAQADALKLLEEALHYRPCDLALNRRAALLCLDLGEAARAQEYAETLCEVDPDDAANHALLARVLRRLGHRKRAADALRRARELDPEHPDVKAEGPQAGRR